MKPISILLWKPGRLLKQTAIAALPSFAKARLLPATSTSAQVTTTTKASGIPALDGLRSVACLLVFNEQFSKNYTGTYTFGYGISERRTIIQWPIIRVMWSGRAMVAIFFVISGYVLSYKLLSQIQDRTTPYGLRRTFASSTFRRAICLYLPSVIMVLIYGFSRG